MGHNQNLRARLEEIIIDNSDWYELNDGSDLQYIENDEQLIKDLIQEIERAETEASQKFLAQLSKELDGVMLDDIIEPNIEYLNKLGQSALLKMKEYQKSKDNLSK